MSEEKMLPCPACGSENILWENVDAVICIDCYTQGPTAPDNELAISTWNAMPRALRWTKEPPTKPGWYWWREGRNEDRLVAHVFIGAHTSGQKYLYAQFAGEGDIVHKIKEMGGEWAGPIPEPKEKG